jgi:predicted nucleic acid-binding protein
MEFSRQITSVEATAAHREQSVLDIELFRFAPFSDRIWELRRIVTAYDAWHVAVAELVGAPLATLDRRLTRAQGATNEFTLPPARRRR